MEPDRHIDGGGVQSGASGSGLGHGACSLVVGTDEQMAALLLAWKERRVLHVERIESALRKKGRVLLVCGGLEGIAEEVEGDIRVECGGTGSAAETLVWEPSPAGAIVREGKVRSPGRTIAEFSWEAGCVGSEISKGDGPDAFGHNNVGGSEMLKWIVEPYGLVRYEFGEDVGSEDLCERAEPQQRVLGRSLMGVGRRFAVSAEKDLIVANDHKNHAGRT